MLRTGASRSAPVDDRQRALGKPRVGCRPVPRRTAPGRSTPTVIRPSPYINQIRALVAELPARPDLELALAILLALLDREPDTWPRAAARWGSRFALERNLTLPDAQLTLAALAVLPGAGGRGGAEALIDLADRHGLRRVDQVLGDWTDRHSLGT